MQTSPHVRITLPRARPYDCALPPAPWLSTTAGNGPRPRGFSRTPWRSTVVPSSVPVSVHVAPDADSGSPAIASADSPGALAGTLMGEPGWHAVSAPSSDANRAARNMRAMIHWTTARGPRR